MIDIVIAVCVLLMACAILFRLGIQAGQSELTSNVGALATVCLIVLFTWLGHGRLWLAEIVPLSNIIVLTNAFPLAGGFLAGLVRGQIQIPLWRRRLLAMTLLSTAWLTVVWTTWACSFDSLNRFVNGVCIQSGPATCSACAAVTLLSLYGIDSSESEMARLCLTSGRGTNLLGIYRGLFLKTRGTEFEVRVVRCDVEHLKRQEIFPLLVPVRQTSGGSFFDEQAPLARLLSIILGPADHCVVLFGFTEEGKAMIGDPANLLTNPIEVSSEQFARDWVGEGFSIVKRKGLG